MGVVAAGRQQGGADAGSVDGEWRKNDEGVIRRHGRGTFSEGAFVYDGEWVEDVMQGSGEFKYASGAVYNGQWQDNKYHGSGTYTWTDGSRYVGGWKENKMHGKGVYTDARGTEWQGTFYNNSGPGLITWYR